MNLSKKVDKLKEDLKDQEANKDNALREQYRDHMEELQQMIGHSHMVFEEKADVVHRLNTTISKKVSNTERVNEMKDLGKREAEKTYKNYTEEQKSQHKREISNLKAQYEYLLAEKEKEFENFVAEFKTYHTQKKEEIHTAREEIVALYKACKKQQTIIENVENGVYTNGIRSAYIPQREKPKIPDRYTTKFLSKALNKIKTASTTQWNKQDDENYARGSIAEGDGEESPDIMLKEAQKRGSSKFNESASGSRASQKGI